MPPKTKPRPTTLPRLKRKRREKIPVLDKYPTDKAFKFVDAEISDDEKSENLRKVLKLIVDYCENELLTGKPDGSYADFSRPHNVYNERKHLTTVNDLMIVLRSCLVSHRFLDAARILELLTIETQERDHVVFKGGFSVLENHPDATPDLVEYFARNVMSLKLLNKKEVILEYIQYRLKNEKPQELSPIIQLFFKPRCVYRKCDVIDPIFKAYAVLIDYISWALLKDLGDQLQEEEMTTLKDRIVKKLSEVVELEGQWDIFVPKLIEVLEFYNEIDEGEAILEKHLEANEKNINAHIFLYEFLKKHERQQSRQVECLKRISRISPSDPLVLDFVKVLLEDEQTEKALRLLLKFVDYADNKNNSICWKMLSEVARSITESRNMTATNVLQNMWQKSISYWPCYHFDPNTVRVRNKEDARLLVHKATFLAIIDESEDHPFIVAVIHQLENYSKYKKRLRKILAWL